MHSTVIPMSNATLPLKKWLKYKHLMSALTQNMPPVTQPLLFYSFSAVHSLSVQQTR